MGRGADPGSGTSSTMAGGGTARAARSSLATRSCDGSGWCGARGVHDTAAWHSAVVVAPSTCGTVAVAKCRRMAYNAVAQVMTWATPLSTAGPAAVPDPTPAPSRDSRTGVAPWCACGCTRRRASATASIAARVAPHGARWEPNVPRSSSIGDLGVRGVTPLVSLSRGAHNRARRSLPWPTIPHPAAPRHTAASVGPALAAHAQVVWAWRAAGAGGGLTGARCRQAESEGREAAVGNRWDHALPGTATARLCECPLSPARRARLTPQ